MEHNEKHLLTVQTSRISSLKSLFFPMKLEFYDDNGRLLINQISRNWIGQKTTKQCSRIDYIVRGFVLRKIYLTVKTDNYGRFWFWNIKKVTKILEKYTPKSSRGKWSDTWF